jgi:hypothetical protein
MKARFEIKPPESAVSFAARLAHVGSFSHMTLAESSAGTSSLETSGLVFGSFVSRLTGTGRWWRREEQEPMFGEAHPAACRIDGRLVVELDQALSDVEGAQVDLELLRLKVVHHVVQGQLDVLAARHGVGDHRVGVGDDVLAHQGRARRDDDEAHTVLPELGRVFLER